MPNRDSATLYAALQESEARYHFLAETVPVQIWTALPNGHLDYVTEQTARAFGRTVEQTLREGWQEVLHPDDLAHAIERWTTALATGNLYEVEFRLRLASGVYAWHLARAVPQRDDSGAILRWFGTNTNIEDQREERRRVEALLEEVSKQAVESEALIHALRAENAALEARLGTP